MGGNNMKHISVEDYYSLSLNEINDITDPALKKEILILIIKGC